METISGLDAEALNRARISRDPRFDGRFYIAVTSTGIYCRPICPSRYAKRSNVRFFASAAAAEAAGFRPCLRCRPEAAPVAVAQTRRLHFAVCLLAQTPLPITQIAMAAGFGSCRRFNDAFRHTYRRAPPGLRKARRPSGGAG